ncbi:hydrogenase expression/formation protein HupK [Tropicibacter sp. R15_0]|uniref:hydrogenase expression/formation protein HupK n=1 Tax=Tropicibacter sp. R15_0 TaxID=2821101 RepID=UPI001ADAEBC8|nr:hydrogenase expression/formation protein HupK [Tropicibacter sp. R15_0]MBO9467334.1 hydrogenase expression/formation protein HupK [Tropicibacter sp. R15_0]
MLCSPAHPSLTIEINPFPPVEKLVIGRSVQEAVELLPRIFNLCRAAQEVAVRLAFGLELAQGWAQALAGDIARDHAMKLAVTLPVRLGKSPMPLPKETKDLSACLFGADGFPETPEMFETYLQSGQGIAPVLQEVDQIFATSACCSDLPMIRTENAETPGAIENTVAARHDAHPVMLHAEKSRGRGPLWRLVAKALDLCSALSQGLPEPVRSNGAVLVPAARGLYAIRATQHQGRVTSFGRVTPTDHILAKAGVLEKSLAALPADKHVLAPLLIEIIDPCIPVTLSGGPNHA